MVDFDGEVQALGSAGRLSRAVGTVVLRLSELTRWFDRGTGSFALSSPVSISGSMGFSARLQESDSDSSLESDSSSSPVTVTHLDYHTSSGHELLNKLSTYHLLQSESRYSPFSTT